MSETKNKFKMPSSYMVILCIIILIAILTHFVKSELVTPAALSDVLNSPVTGFNKGVSVILFVLVIGGFLNIINDTGILDAGIVNVVNRSKGKEIYLIPILMFLFSLGGSTYGMAEETIAFYPLVITTMLGCGYDVLTGVATILLGTYCGVSGSTINPFAIGTAIDSLTGIGIEVNQGIVIMLGGIVWISSWAISSVYLMRYAKRVQKNKLNSLMTKEEITVSEAEYLGKEITTDAVEFTGKMKLTFGLFAASFVIMIIALIPWPKYGINVFSGWSSFLTGNDIGDWYFNDLSVWFVVMSVIIGKINGLTEKQIISKIIAGCKDLMGVAIIVGFSRGISVIMTSTGFDQYILNAGTALLQNVPTPLFATLTYIIYNGLSMLITSTSGLASATVPTFGALAKSLGFAPEIICSVFVGAHFVCALVPTSGVFTSALGMGKIELPTWLRFYGKLFVIISIVNIIIFSVAMMVL